MSHPLCPDCKGSSPRQPKGHHWEAISKFLTKRRKQHSSAIGRCLRPHCNGRAEIGVATYGPFPFCVSCSKCGLSARPANSPERAWNDWIGE